MAIPGWLTKVLDQLGATTPFLYAAAIYGIFHWLDRKASGNAKEALSDRLGSWRVADKQVASALLETFDGIYGYPSPIKIFVRVAIYSIVITLLTVLEFRHDILVEVQAMANVPTPFKTNFIRTTLVQGTLNICSDFISVFIVRFILVKLRAFPLWGLVIGPTIGVMIMLTLIAFLQVFIAIEGGALSMPTVMWLIENIPFFLKQDAMYVFRTGHLNFRLIMMIPFTVIHLWLPIFATSIVISNGINLATAGSAWTQWFIKRGKDHPFDAVGLVAAALVLATTLVLRIFGAV
jgi:hypothetical protein